MTTGTIGEGWANHLSPEYQTTLFTVAYMQGLRMVVDRIHETGSMQSLPENFSTMHDQHTRLVMSRFMAKRAGCACTGCAQRKREIVVKARLRAVQFIRGPHRFDGPGVSL
jgi:predicted chitinase